MTDPQPRDDHFAAVDLGSNSFHMVIARREGPDLVVLDRLREMVRLAAGLDEARNITDDAGARALQCLRRFGERLREIPRRNVRAVGTSTLRRARNADSFISAAETALDHPIEIVSGMEEARLIYLGVAHSVAPDGRRLVIDIGGGSTECIVGEDFEPMLKASLHMGCVNLSAEYFGDGRVTRQGFDRAEIAARIEIEPIEARFRALAWQHAIGSSGTAKAVAVALQAAGWTQGTITPRGLKQLRKRMIAAGDTSRLDIPGVKPERYPVFPGGVAILRAAFDALGIREMRVAEGAMREGLLYDLPGRLRHDDIRQASVERLTERFHIDREHAARVEATAVDLFDQVRESWSLDEEAGWLLRWACTLHELGLDIAHSAYHKHGAYIIMHTDLAGFAREEQQVLSALVRAHRRKFSSSAFEGFGGSEVTRIRRLAVLLRLAVVLHRSRSPRPQPDMRAEADGRTIRLVFPERWLAEQPLTRADLDAEAGLLAHAGLRLLYTDRKGD